MRQDKASTIERPKAAARRHASGRAAAEGASDKAPRMRTCRSFCVFEARRAAALLSQTAIQMQKVRLYNMRLA